MGDHDQFLSLNQAKFSLASRSRMSSTFKYTHVSEDDTETHLEILNFPSRGRDTNRLGRAILGVAEGRFEIVFEACNADIGCVCWFVGQPEHQLVLIPRMGESETIRSLTIQDADVSMEFFYDDQSDICDLLEEIEVDSEIKVAGF